MSDAFLNCEEARVSIGADPHSLSSQLAAHLRGCTACSRYREEMLELERDLHRALALPLPQSAPASHSVRRSMRRFMPPHPWALAATLIVMVGLALVLLALRPSDTLAADVVAHVAGEPGSWSSTERLPTDAVELILRRARVTLASDADPVVYAQSCWFRGEWVPHLVVRTAHGPYTVLVLPNEHTRARRYFNEGGYSGVLLPTSGGTLAVLGRGTASADAAVDEVRRSFKFER